MSQKTGIEKLRILLPHWIEHNSNHIAEFIKWQQVVAEEADNDVVELLGEAVAAMEKSGKVLAEALKKLGGASEEIHHHHH